MLFRSQDPNFINLNNQEFYYFLPINIWNSVHNNALPNPLDTTTATPSEIKNYQQVEAGSKVKVTDGVDNIDLGETFDELPNIKNLQPFEGDIIFEGRFGQSIRFGSTNKALKGSNTWSQNGESGSPITIITNSQGERPGNKFETLVEDINKEGSSIYKIGRAHV